jgi:hypothetical protein
MEIAKFLDLIEGVRVSALNFNGKWIFNVVPDSVTVEPCLGPSWISFDAEWSRKLHHYAVSVEYLTGVELT